MITCTVQRLFGVGVKTKVAGIMHQKREVKIGRSVFIQVERLNGMEQKVEQAGVGFFFPERFVENFGHEQSDATFYGVERYVLMLIIYLYIRYPLHLPVGAIVEVGFNQVQRLKHGSTYRRFFAGRSFHKDGLPAHTLRVQIDNQATVAVAEMVQNDGSGGGNQG